jgi:hypothetical protein
MAPIHVLVGKYGELPKQENTQALGYETGMNLWLASILEKLR